MFEICFVILILELVATLLFLSPLPSQTRRSLVRAVEQSQLTEAVAPYVKFVPVSVMLLWAFMLLEMTRAQRRVEDASADGSAASLLKNEGSLHRAQRDALCGGANVLLLFVVHRLFKLLKEVNQLAATKEALSKQAEGASAAYKAVCAERDEARKIRAAEADKTLAETEDELVLAKETIGTLRERNTALMGERDTANKDVEALKKQAKGLADEYGRVLAQKESLEHKLADYELVFGEGEMKKAK